MIIVRTQRLKLFIIGSILLLSPSLRSAEIIPVETVVSKATSILGSTVIPYREVLLSAQVSGRLLSLNGEVGTAFARGQIIAEIDSTSLLAKRSAISAQVSTAKAALRNAKIQYQRELISPKSEDISAAPGFGMPAMMDIYMTRPLAEAAGSKYDSDMVRYSDLMHSATGLSTARSGVKKAISQLQEINLKIRDAKSIAPFNGMLLQKMVEVGDTVQVGQPLLKFAYVHFLRLKANVPSGLISGLSKGMIVPAKINGKEDTHAKITQIYPVADPLRHTVVVKFDLPVNTIASPGMYAEVILPMDEADKKVNIIPISALLKGRSLPSVLVLNDKGSELRLLRLGAKQGDDKVIVKSGLSEGDRIIDKPKAGAVSGWMPEQDNKNKD